MHQSHNKQDEQPLAKYTLNLEKQQIEMQEFNETRDLRNVDLSDSLNHFSELKETLSGLEMNQDVQESLRKSMHLWGKLDKQDNDHQNGNQGENNPETILEIIKQNKDDALFMRQIDAFVRDLCKKRDPLRDNIQSAKTLKPESRLENPDHREQESRDGLSKKPFHVGKGSLRLDSAKLLKPKLESADDRPLPVNNRQGRPNRPETNQEVINEQSRKNDRVESEELYLDFDSEEREPQKQSIPKGSQVSDLLKKEQPAQLVNSHKDTKPFKTKQKEWNEVTEQGTAQMVDKISSKDEQPKIQDNGVMDSLFLLPENNGNLLRNEQTSDEKKNFNKEVGRKDEKFAPQMKKTITNEKPSKPSLNVSDSLFASNIGGSPSDPTLQFENHIILRIKSSHGGGGKEAGLASLRLFDKRGQEIVLGAENLVMRGCKKEELAKLLEKNMFTTEPSQMWKTEFPFLAGHMDLEIKYFGMDPGYLRIWNYNADKSIGCRNLEIIVNSLKSIDCNLKPGSLRADQNYHQDFQLASDACEPPAVQVPTKKPLTSSQNFNDLFNCENEPKLDESVSAKGKLRKNLQKNNVQITFKKNSGYRSTSR